MQANGAEMLRLACIYTTEAGVEVCAPVHDAVLIHAPLEQLEEHISLTCGFMAEASAVVLDGFRLRTEVKRVRFPERYMDERGAQMWARLMARVSAFEEERLSDLSTGARGPVHERTPALSLHDL